MSVPLKIGVDIRNTRLYDAHICCNSCRRSHRSFKFELYLKRTSGIVHVDNTNLANVEILFVIASKSKK